jgi:O-antigen ligase
VNRIAQYWITPRSLAVIALAGFAILLTVRMFFGNEANLPGVLAFPLAGVAVLAISVRHPAALITPVLFIPRITDLPGIRGFGGLTALQAVCILLGTAIFLRWLLPPSPFWQVHAGSGYQRHDGGFISSPVRMESVAIPFVLFACVVALSYLYSPAPSYGAQKLIGFLTLGGSLFFLPWLVCKEEHSMRDFTIGTVLFGMAVAASSLSFSSSGAMGATENPAHIGKGQVIGLAIVLLLYSPIENRWLRRFVQLVCIPWLAIGLVSAETRGPLFSLVFVLVLSFFFGAMRSPIFSRRQMLSIIAVLAIAVLLLSTFWFYGQEAMRFTSKASEIVALLSGSDEARGTAVQRLVYYRGAFDLWREHPIAGWGIGGWSMAYWHTDDRQYPHNLFLEVLVEQGIVGVAALLFFLRAAFHQLRANLDVLTGKFAPVLPCAIYLLSISMFSGDLDDDRFLWFWCSLISVSCMLARDKQEQAALSSRRTEIFNAERVESILNPSPSGQ